MTATAVQALAMRALSKFTCESAPNTEFETRECNYMKRESVCCSTQSALDTNPEYKESV